MNLKIGLKELSTSLTFTDQIKNATNQLTNLTNKLNSIKTSKFIDSTGVSKLETDITTLQNKLQNLNPNTETAKSEFDLLQAELEQCIVDYTRLQNVMKTNQSNAKFGADYTQVEQQLLDLILVVAKLHNKTVYFKEVTEDKYKEIYDNIKDNVIYLRDYYSGIYDEAFNEIYISPAKYNFLLNYSLLNNDLAFILDELDEWFNLVKESNKQRVCLIHNNLSLEHFIKGMDSYLISWDKYTFDTPVMDIVNLYHNEYLTCDFSGILKEYLKNFKLSVDEEKLLFILLSLPDKVNFDDSEFNNTINVANLVDYIKRTEKLIRPYYTEKQKEED